MQKLCNKYCDLITQEKANWFDHSGKSQLTIWEGWWISDPEEITRIRYLIIIVTYGKESRIPKASGEGNDITRRSDQRKEAARSRKVVIRDIISQQLLGWVVT